MRNRLVAISALLLITRSLTLAIDPVQQEIQLEAAAHAAALSGSTADVDADLALNTGLFGSAASTVSLARRTAAICGWLENDNRYDLAITLANRVLPQLANPSETNSADKEERLYWQGWLQGKVIDNKPAAIASLRAAEKLNPQDERVIDLELELVQAYQNFGH